MPTLLELFSNKKYETLNNQTPKDAFEVRDSKSVPISSTSFALRATATPGIIRLRSGNKTERIAETRLEQENVGLFQYMVLGSPAIYGTDVLRMSSQQTSLVETMKIATGGRGLAFTAAQVVGDTVGEAVKFAGSKAVGVPATFNPKALATKALGSIKNSVGSLFPDVLIPSKVVASPLFKLKVPGISEEYRTHTILANLKSLSAGTKAASFLAQNATGTPDQIKRNLVNQGLNIVQEQAKKAVARGMVNLLSKGGEKQQELARQIRETGNLSVKYSSLNKYTDTVSGEKKFGKNPLNFANEEYKSNDTDAKERNDLSFVLLRDYEGDVEKAKQTKKKFLKELSQNKDNYTLENGTPLYTKVPRKKTRMDYGLIEGPYGDYLNKIGPFDSNEKTEEGDASLDGNDYIPLKFYSVANSTAVSFRGTITGLSEQFSPTWDSSRFIGSPFNFYTYQSIERSVQFTFKVFSLRKDEHKINWEKLSYLSSLVYPQKYQNVTGAISAPFLKITLGDMYKNKECFIENMTYNIDDDYPWEVGLNGNDLQNYRLPMIIEVTITLKFVEAKYNTYNFVTGSTNEQDKKAIGGLMYGYKLSKDDARIKTDNENKNKFKSTNKFEKAPEVLKPDAEKNSQEGKEPYPQDSSPEALKIQEYYKLQKQNISHTPQGQTVARQVYRQKGTKKLYFGDGSPYNALNSIKDKSEQLTLPTNSGG